MKKIFAVLFALTLILTAFTATVSAADANQWTGTITINGSENVPVANKTFVAYQILTAKAVDNNDLEAGVVYSIPAAMQAFYNGVCGKNPATMDDVVAYLDGIKNDAEALQTFSKDALAYAKAALENDENAIPTASSVAGAAANTAEIKNLAFGYYVIEDTGDDTAISALMLKTTAATVNIKTDKPSINKKIDGDKDSDPTTNGLVDYNTAGVGEKVYYELTSNVPDMSNFTKYTYTVTDTFSAGLTFDIVDAENLNTSVKVTVDGEDYTDISVRVNGQVVTIDFPNFFDLADKAGKEIKITYSATVNENAVFGVAGNPNEVYLTYSNNPNEDTTKDTNKDEVRTYLVDLIINKTDKNGDALAGAIFAIKDGAETIATGTSDENGLVKFDWVDGKGLIDRKSYTIVETQAPNGYNTANDMVFTVVCTDPTTGTDCEWSIEGNTDIVYNNDQYETTIINYTGTLLPETGGIGTTIFYTVGGLMMVLAAILLISKKRMGNYA